MTDQDPKDPRRNPSRSPGPSDAAQDPLAPGWSPVREDFAEPAPLFELQFPDPPTAAAAPARPAAPELPPLELDDDLELGPMVPSVAPPAPSVAPATPELGADLELAFDPSVRETPSSSPASASPPSSASTSYRPAPPPARAPRAPGLEPLHRRLEQAGEREETIETRLAKRLDALPRTQQWALVLAVALGLGVSSVGLAVAGGAAFVARMQDAAMDGSDLD